MTSLFLIKALPDFVLSLAWDLASSSLWQFLRFFKRVVSPGFYSLDDCISLRSPPDFSDRS